jgi:hypothetical protein
MFLTLTINSEQILNETTADFRSIFGGKKLGGKKTK